MSRTRSPLPLIDELQSRFLLGDPFTRRECGGCTGCCKSVSVEALGKPMNCRCEFQKDHECTIYPNRPLECRLFGCAWLMGYGKESDRPDKSGLLLYVDRGLNGSGSDTLNVVELWPGALFERHPVAANADFNRLLSSNMVRSHRWALCIYPYGVPRAAGHRVDPQYEDKAYHGEERLIGHQKGGYVNIGVVDNEGRIYTLDGQVIPADKAMEFTNSCLSKADQLRESSPESSN